MTAAPPPQRPRVLLVEDEPHVLVSIKRVLEAQFRVTTVQNAGDALAALQYAEPFDVILSDLKLPHVDGVTLLQQVKEIAPTTVRLLMTGRADVDNAIAAINVGHVFAFLRKPIVPNDLLNQVRAAAAQHQLLVAERELLEQTLHGAVKTLTNLLAITSPVAFGRGSRMARHAADLAAAMQLPNRWEIEVAAMMSQMGGVFLPAELVERMHRGEPLPIAEQKQVDKLPAIENDLLAPIPRLEGVRTILRDQAVLFENQQRNGLLLCVGGRMLKILTDFDVLECQGMTSDAALRAMATRQGVYDVTMLQKFAEVMSQTGDGVSTRSMALFNVQQGMVFGESVVTPAGVVLIARGQDVTSALLARIHGNWLEFAKAKTVRMICVEEAPATSVR